MEAFLLNDKVLTALHMRSIDLKERTKYVKKYDISAIKSPKMMSLQQTQYKQLLQAKKNNFFTERETISSIEQCKKTKDLFSKMEIEPLSFSQKFKPIKDECFVFNGIKKTMKQVQDKGKSSYTQRTCALVSRTQQIKFREYDVKIDITHPRSPKCFFNPQPTSSISTRRYQQKQQNDQDMKQILQKNKSAFISKQNQKQQKMTIKQRIDKEMQQIMHKRIINCKTSYMKKNKSRKNQRIQNQNLYMVQEASKAQMKIYSQIRQNKQNKFKQLLTEINIDKNKPFTKGQINKSTIKILKKYHCDNMNYFNKYINTNE